MADSEVHILQIEIRSKKLSFIMEFLKNISFIKKVKVIESTESQQDVDVPDWHKEIVQKRIKESKPDDFFPFEDLDNKIKL